MEGEIMSYERHLDKRHREHYGDETDDRTEQEKINFDRIMEETCYDQLSKDEKHIVDIGGRW
jgi:hypothetical protein